MCFAAHLKALGHKGTRVPQRPRFRNGTSGATNLGGGMPGSNNQTGDPQFASVVDGSEDFTPANGSPLDSNGMLGVDIGARKATDPAGGGGGMLVHPGTSGGARG